jgi:SAM-dependent methyltransferase
VLDVGCWNYSFERYCREIGILDLQHYGVDREIPSEQLPLGYTFVPADLQHAGLPFEDCRFDGVVLSHVIEHVPNSLELVAEAFRVLRVGGLAYFEAPSERSLWLPSMPFGHAESRSSNFYDDPTHVGRPQTPQSLHRLAAMHGADVIETGHIVSWSVRFRSPWLIPKALLTQNAAMLEDVLWRTFGFAAFGMARKASSSTVMRYVLP